MLAVVMLLLPGMLPARRSVTGLASIPLAALFTVAQLGIGATATLVVPVAPLLAGAVVVLVVNVAALRSRRTLQSPDGASGARALVAWAALGAGVPMIIGSFTPATNFDARVTWFLHARWLDGSQHQLLAAIRAPSFRFLNPDYPPAVPATIAAVWRSTGTHDPELAQFVVAVITAIAIAFSSLMLADMAAERASGPGATARFRHQWWLPVVFTAAALTVVGEFGYNGNIDGFVACSFVGLALALLRRGSSVRASAIVALALSCALSKNEGFAMVTVTALVVSGYGPLRRCVGPSRLIALWASVVMGGAWTGLVRVRGATGAYSTANVSAAIGVGSSLLTKARIATASVAGQLIGAVLVFLVALGLDRLRLRRGTAGRPVTGPCAGDAGAQIDDDQRRQTAVALGVIALAASAVTVTYYVISPNAIRPFLAGSVDRVTTGPKLLFLAAAIVSVPTMTMLRRRRIQAVGLALLGLTIVGKAAKETGYRLLPSRIEASQSAGRTYRCVEGQMELVAPAHARVVIDGDPRWVQRLQAMTYPRYVLASPLRDHRESGGYLLTVLDPTSPCPTVAVEKMA